MQVNRNSNNRPTTQDRFAQRRAAAEQERPELEPVEFVEPHGPRRVGKLRQERTNEQQVDHSPETMRRLRDPFAA